jgi:peptidoglycan/xylan/chitin deacetylase (PgdA/CDA1 family)
MSRGRSTLARSVVVATILTALAGCGTGGPGRPATPTPTISSPTSSATSRTSTPTGSPTPPVPTTRPPSSVPPSTSTPPAPPTTSRPTTPPASGIPAALLGQDVERIPTDRRVVALSFDAGASAAGVPSILATLAREHVPGTFFLTGRFAEQFPTQARQIAAAHRVGNHSVSHPRFSTLSAERIRQEVLGAALTIKGVTGADPAPLFRFPFGDRTASNIAALNALGYVPVRWTVDTLGWKGTSGGVTADIVLQRVLSALRPGEIVLMHVGSNPDDGTTLDAAALPRVISQLRARGYGFVSLDALLS